MKQSAQQKQRQQNIRSSKSNNKMIAEIKQQALIQQAKQQLSSSDADSRIATYLHTVANLQQRTQRLQSQLQYFQSLQQWVSNFIDQPALSNTSSSSSFMSLSSKLNVLERQAIVDQNKDNKIVKASDKNQQLPQSVVQNSKCNMSSHLTYLLRPKTNNKQKICQLQKVKKDLLTRIEQTLVKQQPYLHDKIMKKILKQLKKQSKMTAMTKISQICKEKQKWLKQTKQSISTQIEQKQVEAKVTANLMKMKQLLSKKVINEQYQSQICSDQTNIQRNINKFRKNTQDIKQRLKNQISKTKQSDVEQQLQKIEKQRHIKSTIIQFDDTFIDELKTMIQQSEEILEKPIGSKNTTQLLLQCERLSEKINQITIIKNKKR